MLELHTSIKSVFMAFAGSVVFVSTKTMLCSTKCVLTIRLAFAVESKNLRHGVLGNHGVCAQNLAEAEPNPQFADVMRRARKLALATGKIKSMDRTRI